MNVEEIEKIIMVSAECGVEEFKSDSDSVHIRFKPDPVKAQAPFVPEDVVTEEFVPEDVVRQINEVYEAENKQISDEEMLFNPLKGIAEEEKKDEEEEGEAEGDTEEVEPVQEEEITDEEATDGEEG